MKSSFLDLKNLPDKDKKLLFGEAIRGTVDWTLQKPPSTSEAGKNPDTNTEIPAEQSFKRVNPKESFLQGLVIPYDNTLKSIWDIYLMLLICYSSITTAYL